MAWLNCPEGRAAKEHSALAVKEDVFSGALKHVPCREKRAL